MQTNMLPSHLCKRSVSLICLFLYSALFVSAQPTDLRQAIERQNKAFSAAVARGDGAAVAALYTANAEILPPETEAVRGKEAIQQFWQAVLGSGPTGIVLTTQQVEAAGELAIETGTYSTTGKDGQKLDKGKYLVIWKRDGAQWKLHRDIWNSSLSMSK